MCAVVASWYVLDDYTAIGNAAEGYFIMPSFKYWHPKWRRELENSLARTPSAECFVSSDRGVRDLRSAERMLGDDIDEDLFEHQLEGALLPEPVEASPARIAIVSALRRLPEDVREFALRRCIFLPTGSAAHYVELGHLENWRELGRTWLVLIPSFPDYSPDDMESVVAHEIAHLWLGHGVAGHGTEELDAADQVSRWGFTGAGTRPSWCPLS